MKKENKIKKFQILKIQIQKSKLKLNGNNIQEEKQK